MSESAEHRPSLLLPEASLLSAEPLLVEGLTPLHFLRERAPPLQRMQAPTRDLSNLFPSPAARTSGDQSPRQIPGHHPPQSRSRCSHLLQVLWKQCMPRAGG